jgi:hypothetical protein
MHGTVKTIFDELGGFDENLPNNSQLARLSVASNNSY